MNCANQNFMNKKTGKCLRCDGEGEIVTSVTYEGAWKSECPECLGIGIFLPDAECAFDDEMKLSKLKPYQQAAIRDLIRSMLE